VNIVLWLGDCLVRLQGIEPGSIEAAVFDPPYEINFMSKGWDGRGIAFSPVMWGEVLRCLRPGGTVKAFCGTRTYHRMASAMERAGFIISNEHGLEAWIYGSGFPKSLAVAKAIDKAAYARREALLKEALQKKGFASIVWSSDRA